MTSIEHLPARWRALVGLFAANVALGYTTALLYVWRTTGMRPDGIESRYRGNEADPAAVEIAFPKSFEEMLGLTHSHVLGMVVFLALMAALTLAARASASRARTVLALEPLVALPLSMAGLWLARYIDPSFSWLVSLSSGLAALAFYAQAAIVLHACLGPRGKVA